MALDARTIYECNASATASNVNAGGFNPFNANMLTDLAGTTATGNSPVVSSASYNFVAGDVGHWVYIQAGTNWTPGWYQIASVASNQATLSAAVGEAVQSNSTQGNPAPYLKANTVAGCATTASPTSGTFTIDYSQGTAAILALTNFASVNGSAIVTTASGGFTPVMVGNLWHLASGTNATAGWYEVVDYTDANTITIDRDCAGAADLASGVAKLGGAMSLGSTLDDDFFEILFGTNGTGSNHVFVKNGSYTLGEVVSLTTVGGTLEPISVIGYGSIRGDSPTGSTRPTLTFGANTFATSSNFEFYNLIITGTGTSCISIGTACKAVNCKIFNSSTTANRTAVTLQNSPNQVRRCELCSYRGYGIGLASGGTVAAVLYNYIHDCAVGINSALTSGAMILVGNIIADCVTAAFNQTGAVTSSNVHMLQNTFYGAQNKLGIGLNVVTGSRGISFVNNIVYGFVTGVDNADQQTISLDDFNTYYNNTTDVDGWQKGQSSIAVDPSFTSVAQLTGATATTSGSVLTQSGGNFSTVTDNVDFLYLVSGTGITAGKYLITSHTSTTVTLDIAPGTSATADKVWQITTGHNFLPTGAI